MSPTTTSSIWISVNLPSRFTLTFMLSFSSCNFLKASSLPYSLILEINDDKNIAINIPNVSNQSKSRKRKTTLIIKAIKRILMIGSPKDSIKRRKKPFFFISVKLLLPYFFLDNSTSFLLRPFICISSIT